MYWIILQICFYDQQDVLSLFENNNDTMYLILLQIKLDVTLLQILLDNQHDALLSLENNNGKFNFNTPDITIPAIITISTSSESSNNPSSLYYNNDLYFNTVFDLILIQILLCDQQNVLLSAKITTAIMMKVYDMTYNTTISVADKAMFAITIIYTHILTSYESSVVSNDYNTASNYTVGSCYCFHWSYQSFTCH